MPEVGEMGTLAITGGFTVVLVEVPKIILDITAVCTIPVPEPVMKFWEMLVQLVNTFCTVATNFQLIVVAVSASVA